MPVRLSKRKNPHDDPAFGRSHITRGSRHNHPTTTTATTTSTGTLSSTRQAQAPGHRATRQTPIPPPTVPNHHTSPTQASKRKTATTSDQEASSSPVKKRGRGRPPKAKPDTNTTPANNSSQPSAPIGGAPIPAKRVAAQRQQPPTIEDKSHLRQSPDRKGEGKEGQEPPQETTRLTRRQRKAIEGTEAGETEEKSDKMMALDSTSVAPLHAARDAKDNVRPINGLVAPEISYQAPQSQSQPPWTKSLMRPSPPTNLPPASVQQQHPGPHHHFHPQSAQLPPVHTPRDQAAAAAANGHRNPSVSHTPVPVPSIPPQTPRSQTTSSQNRPVSSSLQQDMNRKMASPMKPPPRADRNIDKVVLGDICFRTWYPSYYGKELLGDTSTGHFPKSTSFSTTTTSSFSGSTASTNAGANDAVRDNGDKAHGKRGETPMLDRLYVCPLCFKYSKSLVPWLGHVRVCERTRTTPPGRKIYTHPRGKRTVIKTVPDTRRGPGKKASGGVKQIEELVKDEGQWSVWEVDGDQDGLFCQNLSLFAKLFLDNKSVFFDVTGFNYFLLVYTPPAALAAAADPNAAGTSTAAPPAVDLSSPPPPRSHIVGFFSKEKMSWDNNNLACILVFPPWQRKGLGALLMGVSYEISRRERIMGGPEKPISDLGKKGYRRFWAGEVARWLLGVNGIASPIGQNGHDDELVVDINDCSTSTWIAVEDCLSALREMGLVEEAGMGPGKKPAVNKGDGEDVEMTGVADEYSGKAAGERDASAAEGETAPHVARLKVDKEAVREWIVANGVSLEKACDPNGFVEGYAVKEEEELEEEESS